MASMIKRMAFGESCIICVLLSGTAHHREKMLCVATDEQRPTRYRSTDFDAVWMHCGQQGDILSKRHVGIRLPVIMVAMVIDHDERIRIRVPSGEPPPVCFDALAREC